MKPRRRIQKKTYSVVMVENWSSSLEEKKVELEKTERSVKQFLTCTAEMILKDFRTRRRPPQKIDDVGWEGSDMPHRRR